MNVRVKRLKSKRTGAPFLLVSVDVGDGFTLTAFREGHGRDGEPFADLRFGDGVEIGLRERLAVVDAANEVLEAGGIEDFTGGGR